MLDDEDGWGAFDPDKDDEEEEDVHEFRPEEEEEVDLEVRGEEGRKSSASRVELVRGANDSIMSDRQLQVNDSLLKDDSIVERRHGSSVASEEPDFGANGGGDLDFDMDSGKPLPPPPTGGLSVDTSNEDDMSSTTDRRRRSNLGDLEISVLEEEDITTPEKMNKRKRNVHGTRMKKRRKIVIDNNQTELTSEQMKAMLRDTSDIVLQNVPSLASWPREGIEEEEDAYVGLCPALQNLPVEQLLSRPCVGDDGGLAPDLLALWGRNMCKITGKAGTQLPFRMRGGQGEKQRGAIAEKLMEKEAADEKEKARSQQVVDEEEDVVFGGADQDMELVMEDRRGEEEEYETPFDIQDEFEPAEYKNGDIAEDDELSLQSDRSSFSLGAVNDLEKEVYQIGEEGEDEDQQPRQVLGEEHASHTTKWHKHTIRVLGLLRRNMTNENDPDNKPQISYNKLSAGCSRRTAAGAFFEILQLKTWDFVELKQETSYGDITITPGLRFDEPPPSASI